MLEFSRPDAHNLGHGVYFETLQNGQIVDFTITSISRDAVDTWINHASRVLGQWPDGQLIRILFDQSALTHLTASPYMKSRMFDLVSATSGRSGKVAIVVGKGFFMQLAPALVQTYAGNMQMFFFRDREEALIWLNESVEEVETVS